MALPQRPQPHPWIPILTGADGVQIGTDPTRAVRGGATDAAAVSAALAAMAGLEPSHALTRDRVVAHGLRLLHNAGALWDADDAPAPWTELPPPVRELRRRATMTRVAGGDVRGATTVSARSRWTVAVIAPEPLRACFIDAIAPTGLRAISSSNPSRSARCLHLLVGRPRWPLIQALMNAGDSHLVISPRAASVRVGPLVVPGVTACLRCLHLSRCDRDPRWPSFCETLTHGPLPLPDPLLVQQAATAAARILVDHIDNQSHLRRSAPPAGYWEVLTDQLEMRHRDVDKHPLCGCWWPPAPES